MKKYVFNAGPCLLPQPAIEATIKAMRDFEGTGVGLLSISHRTPEWEKIMDETHNLWKELLDIPAGYQILFLGGGASTQFYAVPANLMYKYKKAAYLETGTWSKKAEKEAKLFGEVQVVASSSDKNFSYIPKGYTIPKDVDYFHITGNNTIFGTEIREDIDSPVPLVADMSSDIMSRELDVAKYGIIYGGAQKNVGPAGVTFVIIKESLLSEEPLNIPTMVNYKTHLSDQVKKRSMFNTPPVGAIYVMNQTLKWVKSIGGVKEMERRNKEKAELLYDAIDNSKIFVGTAEPESRSRMNVCFVMKDEYKDKEADFAKFATEHGMVGIKGHRSVGGFRASLYNACDKEAVVALVKCMKDFEKHNA